MDRRKNGTAEQCHDLLAVMYYNGNQQLYTRIEHFPISWLKNITALNLYASFPPVHSFTILSHSPIFFLFKTFPREKAQYR